jgi:hypothetical protein
MLLLELAKQPGVMFSAAVVHEVATQSPIYYVRLQQTYWYLKENLQRDWGGNSGGYHGKQAATKLLSPAPLQLQHFISVSVTGHVQITTHALTCSKAHLQH